ncbi:flagellar biosynthetic protein FliR [Alteromonas flava]|uniref:flagellar biosynthetic protein FliR n=1 Tax=Alteromonas flava TaxID=2048003 RepID=UPI000C2840B9|nr:flagellar biosynthetic protein FliR [Alteromonas flava]
MVIAEATIMQFLADYLLAFCRISGMFASMVGLSAKSIPTPIKSLLAVLLTFMLMPIIPASPVTDLVSVGSFVEAGKQLMIGIGLGFISTLVLNTFVLAGQIVAMQTGLGFASIVDPVNGINVPAVGQFYLILATLLFWTLDGHLAMIQMVAMSFQAFPVGEGWWQAEQFQAIAHWAGWMFTSAVIMTLAPIVSLLIVNLAFGVMTKAAPQLNIFSIGFSIAQIMGLVIIWITMANFTNHFEQQWERAQLMMCQLVRICGV